MKKIYLSSTKDDLVPYRQAAISAIRQVAKDVAMEEYVSSDQAPLDKCLSDVRQCDAYVGLFAHRYGFIPPGCDKSITELEYLAAKEKGIPTLIFLVDDELESWNPRFIEHGEGYQKLVALKDRLRKEKTLSVFRNPDDLKLKLHESLDQHFKPAISDEVFVHMIGKPKGRIADLAQAARNAQDVYVKEMEAQRIYLPHVYARRIDIERHLRIFLSHSCTKSGLLVVGKSGIGKTNTLCQIVSQWRDDPDLLGNDVVLLMGATSLPSSLRVEEAILHGLQVAGDYESFTSAFEARRRCEESNAQLVVVVDGADKHPQPKDFLCQINQLIVAGESLGWLKVVVSIGEVAHDTIRASGFTPALRCYYTVPIDTPEGRRESAEVILGRLTEDELREAYSKYRQDPRLTPTSTYESLTDEVKNTISYPLVLRIVMEVFSGQLIPRRILTTDVLCRYYEIKMDKAHYPKREDFVLRFADLLLDSRTTDATLEAVRRDGNLRDSVLDSSPQSAYVQLKEEQVLTEESKRPSPSFPRKQCVAFTYDRLLEYLIAMRISERFGTDPGTLAKISRDNTGYLPIRGAFTALLLDKVITGDYVSAVTALQNGESQLMKAVATDLLTELEQVAPATSGCSDKELAEGRVGRVVQTMLKASPSWSMNILVEFSERLQRLSHYRRSQSVLENVVRTARDNRDQSTEVTALLALANLCTLQGNHPQASAHYAQCRPIIETQDELAQFRPSLLRGIANNYYRLGELDKARACCDEWLRTFSEDQYLSIRADVLRISGVVYRLCFRLADALREYNAGLAIAERLGDDYLRGNFCNNIGEVFRRMDDLAKAEEWQERGKRLRQAIGDRSGLAMSNINLGVIAKRRANLCKVVADIANAGRHFATASALFHEAIKITDDIGDGERKADALLSLGSLMRDQGDLNAAEHIYNESLALFTHGKSKNSTGIVHMNLALLAHLRGDDPTALAQYEEGRQWFEQAGNVAYSAYVYHNLAVMNNLLGQKDAIPELHRKKEYAMGQCPEYPWPDAMRGETETDLVDMPDI